MVESNINNCCTEDQRRGDIKPLPVYDYCRRDLAAIMAHMLPYNCWRLSFLCHSPLDVWGKSNKVLPNIARNNEGRRGRREEEIRERRQIGVGDGRT